MLLLSQCTKPKIALGVTELLCSVTGKQFTAQADGCTTNFARDHKDAILSDEGVLIAIKRDIQARKNTSLYITDVSYAAKVTTWKGYEVGSIIGLTSWRRYSNLSGPYLMYSVTVRMFDGSIWTGRMSSLYECITLRYKDN